LNRETSHDPAHEKGPASRLSEVFSDGADRLPLATLLFGLVAVAMVVVHMLQTALYLWPAGQFRSFHLNLSLLILALWFLAHTPPQRLLRRLGWGVIAALTLLPLAYIHLEHGAMVNERPFLPNRADMAVSLVLIGLVFIMAIRTWGKLIPAIAAAGIAYGYFGYLLPEGLLSHSGISPGRLIGYLSVPYFRGLLGNLMQVSAGVTFMFLVFAGLMKSTGGLDYIMKLAFAVSGRSRSGPAQAAVISSGFMGMISGSIMANVASTGAFTIPLMKRVGFTGSFAGAVEAVASALGQFTPPKMGLAAFLIVGLTGIAYNEVMIAAIFPSAVVYLYLAAAVQLRAVKSDIDAGRIAREGSVPIPLSDVPLGRATLEYGHLFVALAVLVYTLLIQYPAGLAALYGVITLMALESIKQIVLHRRRPLRGVLAAVRVNAAGLADGARSGALVAIVIGAISIMVEMLVVTGFAQKLSHLLLLWSSGSLLLILAITAVTALAFGLGLPTSAAYILVAILGAPALIELGVPELAAHLFIFYMAIMSALTPPVATGALVAASIAEADFLRTAFNAVRLGLPGFVIPFIFVLRPEMLLLEGTLLDTFLVTAVCLIGVIALNFALEGFILRPLGIVPRLLLVPAGLGLLAPGWLTTAVGMGLFCLIVAQQIFQRARGPSTADRGKENGSEFGLPSVGGQGGRNGV
jgi:TRAP transporter 4TM/12TM fusion protein